jgi:hypothetical protein
MLAAIGFTAAAVALPAIDSAPSQPAMSDRSCQIGNVGSGEHKIGIVVRLVTPERARYFIQLSQRQAHMEINPDWISEARVRVRVDGQAASAPALVVVPNAVHVGLGDRVEFTTGQLDPTLPCHYIPNHVVRDLAQAAKSNSKASAPASNSVGMAEIIRSA